MLHRLLLLLLILLTCNSQTALASKDFRSEIAKLLPTETVNDEKFELDANAKFYVFYFLGVECPVARQYGAKLLELSNQFDGKPVQFIGLNSNPQDSKSEVAEYQREFKIPFAMLKDSTQLMAKRLGATRTAEAVLVNSLGEVLYQGRIDDQYSPGVARGTVTTHDLKDTVSAALEGKPIVGRQTTPVGCLITFKKDAVESPTTTFTKDVAPLLWKNCYECHRAGEIGPFDISDYEDLQGWGEMLVEVMEQKRMPPWHASPEFGSFKNERRLPEGMIEVVRKWIDEGMPYGNQVDLPAKPKYSEGWRLPAQPELVVEMRKRPYRVPAEGVVDYQYFVVDPGLTEDRWVSASQIIPGEPSVVHHAIVFIRPPDTGEFLGIGWLNAFVPGQEPVIYPQGYARKIPAGSKLVFQMHYTPNGTEASDITKIGLNFVDGTQVTHQVFTTIAIDQDFEIPPNAANHVVPAKMMSVQDDAILLSISPHMHLRGKGFEVFAKSGNATNTLLKVPHYDFNWQHSYEFANPLKLSECDEISIQATFDNSKDNPFNPNPNEYVMWGDQTWEEMALGYFDVAIPVSKESTTRNRSNMLARRSRSGEKVASDNTVNDFVEDTLKRFDLNNDSVITRSETSNVFRDNGFWVIDRDRDGVITRAELEETARGRSGN
jgi:AhpC/TSA family